MRGHLHEPAGDLDAAAARYRAAAQRTTNLAEQQYLMAKAQVKRH